MQDAFDAYLDAFAQDRGHKTELSDRGALEALLNAAAKQSDPGIRDRPQ